MVSSAFDILILSILKDGGPAGMRISTLLRISNADPAMVDDALSRLIACHDVEEVVERIYRYLDRNPRIAFNRNWSSPNQTLPDEELIKITLLRPTFRDVVRLCKSFGTSRVRNVLESIISDNHYSTLSARSWRATLRNIEGGFRNAALRESA